MKRVFKYIKNIIIRPRELYISSQQLTSLPDDLPDTLKSIRCSGNRLTSVPDNLPATLKELWCAYNQITLLPNDLPATLTRLWCSGNKITTLPDNLPATLEELYCSYNQITSLPNHLPATLKELLCKNNLLTSLPDTLPDTLILFNCSDNPLESNYPLIFTFKPQQAKEIIAYIRECNSMRRVHARTRKINTCNVLLERYMQRAMHPSRLAPLLADPNIDVDAFMEAYVAAL